jgi:type VI secretion system protein ImpA
MGMAPLDMDSWLGEVTAEQPVGPNLEFDADFSALERAAQGKPEQQYGDTIIPAEEPDWKAVDAAASALLERTRDLRVLAHLAVARLHLSGLPAFAGVTSIIRQLLETRWSAVHPQLDPDDDNDPTLRANALLRLAEPARVLRVLRDLPLAASTRAGQVSWRDISIANGALEPDPGRAKLNEASIRAAFAETDAERVAALREAVGTAVADITAIPAVFDREAGPASGPDFTELNKLLRELQRFIDRYAVVAAPPMEEGAAMEVGAVSVVDNVGPARGGAASAAMLGPISTRAEAVRLLELVRDYYEKYEPSSPLPLLIDRARRLADKGFMEILRDLAPNGLDQAQIIAGAENE